MDAREEMGQGNFAQAAALVDGLVTAGVRWGVYSPGSRSTPLALALEAHPGMATEVVLDEREAAFFALGLARATERPVAVVATSGSAPGHWLPAVMEASHGDVPLLLLSADRPPELQRCGAPQTTHQTALFGSHVRGLFVLGPFRPGQAREPQRTLAREAVARSLASPPGPVHLNIAFREPLVPGTDPESAGPHPRAGPPPPRRHGPPPGKRRISQLAGSLANRRGILVCGWEPSEDPEWRAGITALAAALEWPILADPLSGLRFGGHDRSRLVVRYDAFLRHGPTARALRPEVVVRLGRVPTSKVLNELLASWRPRHLFLLEPHGRPLDPSGLADPPLAGPPGELCQRLAERIERPAPGPWIQGWRRAEALAGGALQPPTEESRFEGDLLARALEMLPAGAHLFIGNSLPVRDLDLFSGTSPTPLTLGANRGLNGIDGHPATLAGLCRAGRFPALLGWLGDLTCLHGMGGFALWGGMPLPVVVVENGGGGIFAQMSQRRLSGFERGWLTPQGRDLGHLATLFQLTDRVVRSPQEFEPVLLEALSAPHPTLIRLQVGWEGSDQRRQARIAAVTRHLMEEFTT